ncbi:hypothetical protein Glove_71g154 [Diversispora epigaea]|uniref:Uncharacterized protein n=1 Tax=Diversispora epigaea TaxID=1348612 RepID=A0A397JEA7_9GLOM|nr:hypothetical protein Glove_71g154 [Diversispora epigaea]
MKDHDPASNWVKRENWDTKSQMSLASAHIKRLLPYRSYKVYPKALAEIARSSARIPNLLSYHSYKSQISLALAHIKRLLPYCSYKVYPKALAKIARSSAHIPNLLPYRSYKVVMEKTPKDLARPTEI